MIMAYGRMSQPTKTQRSLVAITGREYGVAIGGETIGTGSTRWSGAIVDEQLPACDAQLGTDPY